jgi:NADPH2:quinone reductase
VKALVAAPGKPGNIELREVEDPSPGNDQALVSVKAASVNRGDLHLLARADAGWRPGSDVAGVVERRATDGWGPAVGTRVVGLVPNGGWAELVAVDTRMLAHIPDDLDFATASTLPVAGLTAMRGLAEGGLIDGKRVLVTGSTGGVGTFAVQLAAHAAADVTAVVSSPERGEPLPALGAQQVVVGMPEDGDFDLIMESVGGDSLAAALRLVAPNGSIVSYGNSSHAPTTFDAEDFYTKHGARLVAFLILDELARTGGAVRDLMYLADLAAQHKLECIVSLTASWRDPIRLLQALHGRQLTGKAVMLID